MLSLARATSKRSIPSFSRGLAQEVRSYIPANAHPYSPTDASSNAWTKGKVPVKEDHGLYAFFRRKPDAKLTGEDAYETVESPKKDVTGRAWRASELRLKSFKDLHTLWYVTLRERNLLATQKEEARKAGITINLQAQTVMASHCRKTMARIKAIMNERRIAYQGALELYAEHGERAQDSELLRLQREALGKAQEKLTAFQSKGRMLRRARRALGVSAVPETEADSSSLTAATEEAEGAAVAVKATPEPMPEPVQKEEVNAEAPVPAGAEPQSTVETAAAGLFGEPVKSEKKP